VGAIGVEEIGHQNLVEKCAQSAERNHMRIFYTVRQIINSVISATNEDIFQRSVEQRDGEEISEMIDGMDRFLEKEAKTHHATQ